MKNVTATENLKKDSILKTKYKKLKYITKRYNNVIRSTLLSCIILLRNKLINGKND